MPKTPKVTPEVLNLEATLQVIIKKAVEALGGSAGVVATWNEAKHRYVISASYGLGRPAIERIRPLLKEAAPDLAGSRDSYDLLSQLYPDTDLPLSVEGVRQDPILALPLKIGEVSVGLIFILRPLHAAAFSRMDQPVLAAFAEQAAIAMQNARLAHLLAEEKQRTNSILEHNPNGIMSIDSQCRILGFNAAMEKLTGFSREEVIDRECFRVLYFRDWEGKNWCTDRCPLYIDDQEEGQIIERQGKIRTKNGRDIDVSINYALVRNPEGDPINAVANVRDISEMRQLESLRETFLAMLGHELQTPIAIIKGYASALSEGKWDQDTLVNSLKIIEEESDNLSRVVNRLLLASRITSGSSPLNKELLDMESLAGKIIRRRQAANSGHTFELHFDADFPPVTADPQLIEEVLNNLVDNAIKYSPEGGKISISGEANSKEVRVSVSDEGIGISEEGMKHLFERFYREGREKGRSIKGLGLGLYICKTIIEAHGGSIEATSRVGEGSRFTFTLPLQADP